MVICINYNNLIKRVINKYYKFILINVNKIRKIKIFYLFIYKIINIYIYI